MITFTAVDFFEVIELENYDFLNLANTDNINIETLGKQPILRENDFWIQAIAPTKDVCQFGRGRGGAQNLLLSGNLISV